MYNVDFILNLSQAQDFLNKNANEIFGRNDSIKLINIKQSRTYNPEAYNLLYKVNYGNQNELLRVSSSKIFSKKHDYLVMKYFYTNGFNNGPYLVPKPLAFFEEANLLFYQNIRGDLLRDVLEEDINSIEYCIEKSSRLLKKIHSLRLPDFALFDTNLFFKNFNFESIVSKYPELKNIGEVIGKIKNHLESQNGKYFCHGDFNPNNIILTKNNIYIIDFGLTCIFHKEIDIASFLVHLKLMLRQVKRDNEFDILKNNFLKNYGGYNERILNLLTTLIDIRLLEIAINYKNSGYDEGFVCSCLIDDLEKSTN